MHILAHSGNTASSLQTSVSALPLSLSLEPSDIWHSSGYLSKYSDLLLLCSLWIQPPLISAGSQGMPRGGGSNERQLYSQASHAENENFHAFD